MYEWPLINDNISEDDKEKLVEFIRTPGVRFTQHENVRKFEEEWSSWLGTSHTTYVNSGASTNWIMASILKEVTGPGEVILSPFGWVSDVVPFLVNGFKPVFVDVDMHHMSSSTDAIIDAITEDTKAVLMVHILGFNGLTEKLMNVLDEKGIMLIEDCCESHGAEIYGKKVGTHSEGSTFSSYFGHHMTTVEGGFVSTDDEDLYELMRAKRSHGLARECSDKVYQRYIKQYPDVDKRFMFITDGYNFRNTEFGGVLGLSQLPRLDSAIKRRREICDIFEEILCDHWDVFDIPDFNGNSSFCLPFILKDRSKRIDFQEHLESKGVETRPLCSGNLLRQPFLSEFEPFKEFPQVDYLHYNGFFIGNNHLITNKEIEKLRKIIDDYFSVL